MPTREVPWTQSCPICAMAGYRNALFRRWGGRVGAAAAASCNRRAFADLHVGKIVGPDRVQFEPGRVASFARKPPSDRTPGLAIRASSTMLCLMTTIATCSNPAEAMLLKSLLEANGIAVYAPDELTAQSAPHFSGSGIRIQVDDAQAEAAKRMLAEVEAASSADAGEDKSVDEDDKN